MAKAADYFRQAAESGFTLAEVQFISLDLIMPVVGLENKLKYKFVGFCDHNYGGIRLMKQYYVACVFQVNLGNMYYHGLGVKKDLKKAKELYQKAAPKNHNARLLLEEIEIEEKKEK